MTLYAEDLRLQMFVSNVAEPDPANDAHWTPVAPSAVAAARFTPSTATPMTFAAGTFDSATWGSETGYTIGQTWGGIILYCRRGSNPTGTLTIAGGDFGGIDSSITINATDLPEDWRWCHFPLTGGGASGGTSMAYITTTEANQIEIIGNGTNFYAGGYTTPWVGGSPVGNGDMQSLVVCGTIAQGAHVEHTPTTNTTEHANTLVEYGIWGIDPDGGGGPGGGAAGQATGFWVM
jgi:hypothetical protein